MKIFKNFKKFYLLKFEEVAQADSSLNGLLSESLTTPVECCSQSIILKDLDCMMFIGAIYTFGKSTYPSIGGTRFK